VNAGRWVVLVCFAACLALIVLSLAALLTAEDPAERASEARQLGLYTLLAAMGLAWLCFEPWARRQLAEEDEKP
jgi:type VI protein secretion system component VasK